MPWELRNCASCQEMKPAATTCECIFVQPSGHGKVADACCQVAVLRAQVGFAAVCKVASVLVVLHPCCCHYCRRQPHTPLCCVRCHQAQPGAAGQVAERRAVAGDKRAAAVAALRVKVGRAVPTLTAAGTAVTGEQQLGTSRLCPSLGLRVMQPCSAPNVLCPNFASPCTCATGTRDGLLRCFLPALSSCCALKLSSAPVCPLPTGKHPQRRHPQPQPWHGHNRAADVRRQHTSR